MPQSAFAITVKYPDIEALLAALHAGGPDLRMKQAGQGAVAQLCTEDGNPVVSLEAPRYIQVPGETARLLGDVVHRDGPLWWTEVRASTAVPEAQRLAASIAGRLAALLDGVTWPSEAAAHTEVVTLPAVGTHPSPGDGDGVLAEADVLTDQSAVILYDIPVLAVTTWLTELLRTPEQTGRHLYLVTPSSARLTLAARTVLDRAAARWVIRDPGAGYYDGLSGMVLSWRDGHFTPVTDPSPTVAEAFRPPAGGAVELSYLAWGKKAQMFQPAVDQLIFADDPVKSGVPSSAICFEQKNHFGADVDVQVRDSAGEVYAYQLIHLNNPADPVNEITRVKYLGQLEKAEVHHRILLVDGGQGTKADWISRGYYDRPLELEQGWRVRDGKPIVRYGEPVTFVIRLEDGNLVIPPGRKLDPEGKL